jgi:hypothetical protein
LPPASTAPAVSVVANLAASVIDTGGACTLTCKYVSLRIFQNPKNLTLMLFSGAQGRMINEKNLKQKIS